MPHVFHTPGPEQLAYRVHPGDEPTLVVVAGWALTGDAAYCNDPSTGFGIWDAFT